MNCNHNWSAIDWNLYPTFLIPPELRGNMPKTKICRMCWTTDDSGINKILDDYQTTKDEKEETVRRAKIL